MGKDPAMPLYVNDWLSSPKVQCMNLQQQAAYMRLLCFCWASGSCSIPDDHNQLAILSGAGEDWHKGGYQMVIDCFEPHPEQPGKLTNSKLWDLFTDRREWKQKSSEGGKRGSQKRWEAKNTPLKADGDRGGHQMVMPVVKKDSQPNDDISSSSSLSSSIVNNPPTPKGVKAGKSQPSRFDAAQQPLPPGIDTFEVQAKWLEWCAFRRRRKPITEDACRKQLADLARHGPEAAIAAIDRSIKNDWQGLFPDRVVRQFGDVFDAHRQFAGATT